MTDLAQLLESIDTVTAPVCAQCDGSLNGSPSADFCGPDCQERWHALRSHELVGYREPLYEWATLGPWPEDFESDSRLPDTARYGGYLIPDVLYVMTVDTSPFEEAIRRMAARVDLNGDVYFTWNPDGGLAMRGRSPVSTILDEVQWHSVRVTAPVPPGGVCFEWRAPSVAEVVDLFAAALRPDPEQTAERHIEACGVCTNRADVDRHAARLGVEVNDLNHDCPLSWPAHSMRAVIADQLPPVLEERAPIHLEPPPSTGPERRRRVPRTLGRSR